MYDIFYRWQLFMFRETLDIPDEFYLQYFI